jgi:hypothetical protein
MLPDGSLKMDSRLRGNDIGTGRMADIRKKRQRNISATGHGHKCGNGWSPRDKAQT